MTTIDKGRGPAVVLIPGVQGRWEYLRPAVDALATVCRVLTFSLCGEPGADAAFEPARGYENDLEQIDRVIAGAGLTRVVLAGVSAGGSIAIRYAASRPQCLSGLVLASTPPPRWQPEPRIARYIRRPLLAAPLFYAGSLGRLGPEIRKALPGAAGRWRFVASQLKPFFAAPLSPARMADRAVLLARTDLTGDCAQVRAPTLVITGERDLDRVVPVEGTREYLRLIAGARTATIERTGHLGTVTRPDAFAMLVQGFLRDCLAQEPVSQQVEVA